MPRCPGTPRSRQNAPQDHRTRTRAPRPASRCRDPCPGTPGPATNRCLPSDGPRTAWQGSIAPRSAGHRARRPGGVPNRRAATPPGRPNDAGETRVRTRDSGFASRRHRTASRRVDGCRPSRRRSGVRVRSAVEGPAVRSGSAARTAARPTRGRCVGERRRPWAPDGTLRPWVLSRRWKTSSRSSTAVTARAPWR